MTAHAPAEQSVLSLARTPLPKARSPWLISPGFDLLMVANVYWPLLILLSWAAHSALQSIDVWLAYLLITPHRWMTLVIVFGDHDRYAERPRAFLGLAVALATVVAVNAVAVPTLTLLLVIDFVWNAWHFSAQHAGIARIYSRLARPTDLSWVTAEKYLLRAFCLYVIFRLGAPLMAADRSQWFGWLDAVVPLMTHTDLPMMVIPLLLLAREIVKFTPLAKGRLIYLGSVLSLYGGTLLAAHFATHRDGPNVLLGGLLVSLTAFHSLEYLAIVTWSVGKRYGNPDVGRGPMTTFARRWWVFLLVFLGSLGLGAFLLEKNFIREWFLVNMLVSFLHYAYDGLIWKAKPPTVRPSVS
jgi:hypothetical protein